MVDEIHYYFAIVFRYENTYYLRLSTSVRNMKLDVRGDIMAIYQFPVTDHTTTVTNYLSVEYDIFQEDEIEMMLKDVRSIEHNVIYESESLPSKTKF